MTANIERELGELRSDVRHIQTSLERLLQKQDEFLGRFGEHISDDARLLADLGQKIEVAAAEKRGEGRIMAVTRWVVTVIVAALAGVSGGHVGFPGSH